MDTMLKWQKLETRLLKAPLKTNKPQIWKIQNKDSFPCETLFPLDETPSFAEHCRKDIYSLL